MASRALRHGGRSRLIDCVVELTVGTVVAGRFVLDRKLGEGGMGVVWAATHAVTRKPVALKMLKPDKATDPVVRQRFVREARAASVVTHPNIIEIRDVIELDDGSPVMVMDLLQGESLGDRLEREGTLPVETLAPLMLQVLSAVGTAHAAGIVHRDLKPDNIFLVQQTEGGISVRVLDFGIAKVMPTAGELPTGHGLTDTGAMLGTPFYMAPEQIFGERDIDQQADVWAIGVILYECLAGCRPTEAENIGQILRIISDDAILPLEKVAPDLPADVVALVGSMLQRNRVARPTSLRAAFDVMRRHAPGLAVASFGKPSADARPERLPAPATSSRAVIPSDGDASPTAATLASTTASTTADRSIAGVPSRRRRALTARVAVVACVGACGLALFVGTRHGPAAPVPSAATSSAPPPSFAAQPSIPDPVPDPPIAVAAPAPSLSAVASVGRRPPPGGPPAPRPATSTATPPAPQPLPQPPPVPKPSPYEHM